MREEIELPEEEKPQPKLWIRVENLSGLADTDRIVRRVKEGNVILLRVLELQRKDLGHFKAAINKLKRECARFGWDIVGLAEGYVLITPERIKISR